MKKEVIIGIVVALFAVLLAALIAVIIVKHSKSKQRKEFTDKVAGLAGTVVQALGSLNNIESVDSRMSRLSIVVKDSSLVNLDMLKENGLSEIIVMEKKIVIVVGDEASKLSSDISNLLEAKKN